MLIVTNSYKVCVKAFPQSWRPISPNGFVEGFIHYNYLKRIIPDNLDELTSCVLRLELVYNLLNFKHHMSTILLSHSLPNLVLRIDYFVVYEFKSLPQLPFTVLVTKTMTSSLLIYIYKIKKVSSIVTILNGDDLTAQDIFSTGHIYDLSFFNNNKYLKSFEDKVLSLCDFVKI
ncbi:hypothetical protein AGLY_013297 [Aphis glycines]|uniref:Uncharacterized protein n=1 Tax=Aphis glycines TaxID=307491 RepID=A0A6G0T812_APHGL|nr:hypothetical protein AGLY_013297 [Aphis glycines]